MFILFIQLSIDKIIYKKYSNFRGFTNDEKFVLAIDNQTKTLGDR